MRGTRPDLADLRLTLIRAAAGVRLWDDRRTVAEALRDELPRYLAAVADARERATGVAAGQSPRGSHRRPKAPELAAADARSRLSRSLADRYLPGAQWLADVVEATLEHWAGTPGRFDPAPPEHAFKLALPMVWDFNGSGVVGHPSDPAAHARYLEEEEREHFAALERRAAVRKRRTPPPTATPTRPPPRRPGRPPGRTLPRARDLELLAGYQWGELSLSMVARELGVTREGARKALGRFAGAVGLRLRGRDGRKGGRPRAR